MMGEPWMASLLETQFQFGFGKHSEAHRNKFQFNIPSGYLT